MKEKGLSYSFIVMASIVITLAGVKNALEIVVLLDSGENLKSKA